MTLLLLHVIFQEGATPMQSKDHNLMYAVVVWYGVVWCGMVRCGMLWYGVAWCGMVWYGAAWCGIGWCGVTWNCGGSTFIIHPCVNYMLCLKHRPL